MQKALTAESGSIAGRAEPGESLTYTFTLTNAGTLAQSTPYSFYEVLPANTSAVSLSGGTTDCGAGDTGARLCTLTHPGPIAANGGTATMTMTVQVASSFPPGVNSITNLVLDDATTIPPGCTASDAPCSPAPSCDPVADPDHCVVTPVQLTANLVMTKTNTPASGPSDLPSDTVSSGATTTYTVVVTNNGPDAVTGAVVSDTPGAGLTCPAANPVTCTGASCPAGPLTTGDLTAGVTLGTLFATAGNNTVSFTVTCTVN